MYDPQTLDSILTWLLRLEDSTLSALATNLGDGAGLTRLGITTRDAALVPPDFFTCPRGVAISAAKQFYITQFWQKFAIDTITDPPLAAAYLSCAVNTGPHQAHDFLAAARAQTALSPIDAFSQEWCDYYYQIAEDNPHMEKFLVGWLKRARAIYPALPE
jgi:Glycosyl hydrolase 108